MTNPVDEASAAPTTEPGDAPGSPQAPAAEPRPASLLDFDTLSIEAKNLNAAAATDLPRDSSTVFSLKLLSHLEVYWEERSSYLALDAKGAFRVDYAAIFRSLEALLDEPPGTHPDDAFIRLILEQAVLIEPDSFSYFVQGLGGAELLFLAAYHDLAMAMVCYKAAARVDDPVQRRMLFDHTDGALEKLRSTRRRFENVRVPTVIREYAEAITLKITIEMARKVPTKEVPPRIEPPGAGRVRVFVATSLDGFIAGEGDDLSWLPQPGPGAPDHGFRAFFSEVGAVLLGRRTFDVVAGLGGAWPYGDRPVLVATHRPLTPGLPTVRPVSGPIADLVAQAHGAAGGRDVYLDGGDLIRQALDAGLVAEVTTTVIPVVLGRGLPLLAGVAARHPLTLVRHAALEGGLLQLTYAPVTR